MQTQQIGTKAMICLIANQIIVKLFIGQARLMTTWVGNSGWMLYIAGLLLQGALFLLTLCFYAKTPDRDPMDLGRDTFGRVGEVVIGIVFFIYFMLSFISLFRLYAEALKATLATQTPILLVALMLLICVGLGGHAGVFPLADLHSIFVPLAVVLVLILCLANGSNFEIYNVLPLWGKGMGALSGHLPYAMGASSEITALYFLLPYAEQKRFPKKAGLWALGLGGGLAFAGISAYCLAVDYPESTQYLLSMYQLSRLVHVGASLNRIENITEFFWVIFIVLALAFKLWMAAHILKKICRLPESKPLVWPLALLGLGIGFLPQAVSRAEWFYTHYFVSGIRWEISFLPLVAAVCYAIKKKGRDKVCPSE